MRLRILLAVTHLLGVGHLSRAAAIARGLAAAGHDVTLVSGGMPAPLVRLDDVRLVQLPPLRSDGTAFSTLLDMHGAPAATQLLATRRAMMAAALRNTQPHVVITELFPFGRRALADEFLALLDAAHAQKDRPAMLASVRDVLVAPERPERITQAHERLTRYYDGVLVHGDEAALPLEASWPLTPAVKPLLRYTGYIDDAPAAAAPAAATEGEILVSGGGSAASLPLYAAALGAARLMPERPWRLLVGAGVPEDAFRTLLADVPANAVVERARRDFPALLAACAASVNQAGYNTVVDLLRARARSVSVPFEEAGETEQRQRAEFLAARGLMEVVPQAALSPEALTAAVRQALARPRPAATALAMNGIAETVRIVQAFAAGRTPQLEPSPAVSTAAGGVGRATAMWRRLDEALAAYADAGGRLDLWWRDDDAVRPTAALDRLLALTARLHVPVALAVVPAAAEAALAARLREAPHADVLVHGLAHANHAPASDKKAEFGAHRPLAALTAEAMRAFALTRDLFGARGLPVFVPPWNRIAPALVPRLPDLGFAGLSTFRARRSREAALGVALVNTHLDPIAWHGSRSLIDEDELLATLVAAIEARQTLRADPTEPFGFLTHHLVHDEAIWTFCERLLERMLAHPAVRPVSARAIFAVPSEPRTGQSA